MQISYPYIAIGRIILLDALRFSFLESVLFLDNLSCAVTLVLPLLMRVEMYLITSFSEQQFFSVHKFFYILGVSSIRTHTLDICYSCCFVSFVSIDSKSLTPLHNARIRLYIWSGRSLCRLSHADHQYTLRTLWSPNEYSFIQCINGPNDFLQY